MEGRLGVQQIKLALRHDGMQQHTVRSSRTLGTAILHWVNGERVCAYPQKKLLRCPNEDAEGKKTDHFVVSFRFSAAMV